jgi:hypothetical protein
MEQTMALAQPDDTVIVSHWTLDLRAAADVASWAAAAPARLEQEAREMAARYPRWALTGADARGRVACRACREPLVCRDGKLRCVRCRRVGAAPRLAWMGHLAIPVAGRPRALARIRLYEHPDYPALRLNGALLWMVPLLAIYPDDWPASPPVVRCGPDLLRILDLEKRRGALRLDADGALQLQPGAPRAATVRAVLEDQVTPHLAAILAVADGDGPLAAFRTAFPPPPTAGAA